MSDQPLTDDMAVKQALKAVHGMYIKQQINLLNALKTKFGTGVTDVIREANSRDVCQAYKALADAAGGNSIADLIRVLWEPLRSKGYVFTMEEKDGGVQMHCTTCPFAMMYRAMGGEEWGYALYCAADEDLARAINPQIGFKRSQTLMEGDACCDHFYFYRDQSAGN